MCLAGIRFTTHCNFKTYVNAPHVNIYHIESVSQENNHIIFFKVHWFFLGGWGGVGYIYIHYIPIYPRRYAPGYSLTTFCLESGSQYLSASNDPPPNIQPADVYVVAETTRWRRASSSWTRITTEFWVPKRWAPSCRTLSASTRPTPRTWSRCSTPTATVTSTRPSSWRSGRACSGPERAGAVAPRHPAGSRAPTATKSNRTALWWRFCRSLLIFQRSAPIISRFSFSPRRHHSVSCVPVCALSFGCFPF